MKKSSPGIKYLFSALAFLMIVLAAYSFVVWMNGAEQLPSRQNTEIR